MLISRFEHPAGTRMRSGRVTETTTSYNWSGLVQSGDSIEGARASWTVPAVQAAASPHYSSTWVGVDGYDNQNLIQTGTSQDTSDGYYAWWEILPLYAVMITNSNGSPAPVAPGDQMTGSVEETPTAGTWTIYLDDVTEGWYYEQNFTYDGPGTSAEWIEESPTVSGSISTLANFGSVQFTQTSVYGDLGPSGTTWYGTDLGSANEIDMLNGAGSIVLAAPSPPTFDPSSGQDFTDTYEDTSIEQPVASITSPNDNDQLGTAINVDYSAADSSSPIASYNVRYDRGSWNVSYLSAENYPATWQETPMTSEVLNGIPGDEYCFDVQATSQAGISSPWTPDSCAVLPLGEASLTAVGADGWTRRHAHGYYLDSFATSTTDGATLRLSGAWASQVAVVAARCRSCGIIDVFVNGKPLGRIDTYGMRLEPNRIFVLPGFAFGRVTVRLESVSKHSRVIVEGMAVN
jgi:hypothetical protein